MTLCVSGFGKIDNEKLIMLGSRANLLVRSRLVFPNAIFASHSPLCPTKKNKSKGPVCGGSKGGGKTAASQLKRAEQGGKVRLGFLPEEWFLFFHSKTGVSGPYIFGIVLANYLASKEIFIMEHEYYLGLSIMCTLIVAVKKLGPDFAKWLDEEVDNCQAEFDRGRKEEVDAYENQIKESKDAQFRAEGQKMLMDAKKENIQMQLEAAYRERCMLVYRTVKGRMDYHSKRYQAEARIHQRWMLGWILQNVKKSITADFEKQALEAAIRDLSAAANRAK